MDLSAILQFCPLATARQLSEKQKRRAAICRRLAPEGLEPRLLLAGDPIAHNDHYQTYAGGTFVVGVEKGLLANDSAPANETLTAAAVSQPEHGKLTFQPDGSFTYLPDAGFKGHDDFTYRLSTGTERSNVAAVSLDVLPQSAAPKPHKAATSGITPFTSMASPEDGAVLSVGDAEAQAGATLDFDVSLSNVPSK